MKTTVHIISHSHWDREWYMAFEQHRMKLIELIDTTMELFEKEDSFHSFHLDGQTIVLDDYLEIKPQNREKIEKYVQEGRFLAGPWYILQDEFLTSGESNVRNLLTGMKEAEEFGKICKVGYFPDAFGNAGQMPQLLKQAGMKAVIFGRGVKPVGCNNTALEGGEYESAYSEMNWESPDGSSLLGILFANWYNNGAEIPVDPQKAKIFWDERLKNARRFAGTNQLLFMNGCDHQPVQKDLSEAIETARSLYPDIEFVHSDFNIYVDAVKSELREGISTVRGELTSQETDGLWTLVNTASSWMSLKQMNRVCETALEREAEPMAAMASIVGKEYPKELLKYSWKKLMQNHPHDSICGCSVDEVNMEMKTRFEKSRQVANAIFTESLSFVAEQIDTGSIVGIEGEKYIPLAVFNTTGWNRTGVVTAELDYERCYGRTLTDAYRKMEGLELPLLSLKDSDGNCMAVKIEDLGAAFGYDLPDDKFRQTYMARKIRVTFEAENVPALGYRTYFIGATGTEKKGGSLVTADRKMENEYLAVEIHDDGSYTLTEKSGGKRYSNLGYYEETGDVGNEYIYIQDKERVTVTTKGLYADVTLLEDSPYCAVYQIKQILKVPESADEILELERNRFTGIHERQIGRSSVDVNLPITTLLTLERHSKGVKVETIIENTAKDHRIRVMVPTELKSSVHLADSVFEVVKRNNQHSEKWTNPCGCERQQNFVAMSDGRHGILVANFGLYEYEILPEQDNTIAVTLLRGIGEMGDWGVFSTPGAQMLGMHTLRYELVPFREEELIESSQEAYQFQTQLVACQLPVKEGNLPLKKSFLNWSGRGLNLTGLKQKEESDDLIVRYVNNTGDQIVLTINREEWMENIYRSNVIEENLGMLEADEKGAFRMIVHPYEIATVGIQIRK